jgi:membrane protein
MSYQNPGPIQRLFDPLRSWWTQRSQPTRELPIYIRRAFGNFGREGSSRAAALAYYAIFSIFPLTLLIAIGVNQLLGPTVGQQQIAQGLQLFLPFETVQLLQSNVSEAINQGGQFTIVAVIFLVWSALGLFTNLSHSLDIIFRVPAIRSLWRKRLLAFLMVLILIALIAASFITSGLLRLVGAVFIEQPSIWILIGILFLPFSLNLVIFILLFRYVPAVYVHWQAIWPAAIFGSVGWEIAKVGFAWFLENLANFALVYAIIAPVIVFLLYAYITASVLIISAELCARINEWLINHRADYTIVPGKIITQSSGELPASYRRLKSGETSSPPTETVLPPR